MWNKRDDEVAATPRPAGQPAPPNVPQPAPTPSEGRRPEIAAIGASITIVGDVSGSEDLTILGRVEGKVTLPNHSVTIGRSGRVTADIHAKAVNVEGEVRGNLTAGEQILIRKSATMLGNLTAPRVGLEDGCRFKGSVDMEAGGEKPRSATVPIPREVGADAAPKLAAAPRP
jgi:cytoskeletal protein CcmA (bactofilin family)